MGRCQPPHEGLEISRGPSGLLYAAFSGFDFQIHVCLNIFRHINNLRVTMLCAKSVQRREKALVKY